MTAAARARAPARPARFAADPQRRVMIAKLHLAKKQLNMAEDDYRDLLARATGERSAADCSRAQLEAALAEMTRLGFTAAPKSAASAARKGSFTPAASKARAMLISLGLMGVIRDSSEKALEAFARRQLGVDRLTWADEAQVYKLIEALKAIANRNGWNQSVTGLADPVWTLKLRLCEAILAKMIEAGIVPAGTALAAMAGDIWGSGGRVMQLTHGQLEQLAAALGARLKAGRPE
jgi:phage gp16-like protein